MPPKLKQTTPLHERQGRDQPAVLDELMSAIAGLEPLVSSDRSRIDRERQLSDALTAALLSTGVCRIFTPREYDGLELDPVSGFRAIAAVSELDGSLGWCAMISGAYSFLAGRLPEEAARTIYGDERSAVAGQLKMSGQAKVSDSGYLANGRWTFGSGSKQATWFLGQCVVLEDGRPRPRKDPAPQLREMPDLRLVFVPASRVEIFDTWHVSGLRGTGSNDYAITDVEVPEGYAFDLFTDEPTRREPLYQAPALPVLNGAVAAVPIGIARGAVNAFKKYARTKVSLPNPDPIRESAIVQADVARAEIALRSSELLLFTAMDDIWDTVKNGGTANGEQRAHFRLGCVNAGMAAAHAVDLVYNLAGSAAILESYPFERCFRDVYAATAHHAMHKSALVPCGQALLGIEPKSLL